MVAGVLLVGSIVHAEGGFTKAELDALPKPDPIDPIPGPIGKIPPPGQKPPAKPPAVAYGVKSQPIPASVSGRAASRAMARRNRMARRVEQQDWGMLQVQAAAMRVWRGGLP